MSSALTLFSYMSTTQTSWSGRASLGGLEITAVLHSVPFPWTHGVADSYPVDLGAVVRSGEVFLFLCQTGVRQAPHRTDPHGSRAAAAGDSDGRRDGAGPAQAR